MPRAKRYDKDAHYFPGRLTEKLEGVLTARTTVVEAPSGYGKTTAIGDFFAQKRLPEHSVLLWHVCLEEPPASAWKRFCRCVQKINLGTGNELLLMGLPDEDTVGDVVSLMWEMACPAETWLVIDDFQMMKNAVPAAVWQALIGHGVPSLHLVILTQMMDDTLLPPGRKPDVLYLDSNDLRLNREETEQYFFKVGIALSPQEVQEAYHRTEGWMIALYLQMLHYLNTGKFTATSGIRTLIRGAVWEKLAPQEQEFLLRVSPFDGYTLRQAARLLEKPQLPPWARRLSEHNAFIRYDPASHYFYLHTTLLEFVREEFEALDEGHRRQILYGAAAWCEENHRILQATTFYYRMRDYERMLMMDFSGADMAQADGDDYRAILLDIAEHATPEMKLRNPDALVKLSFELFGAGCYEEFGRLCAEMGELIGQAQLPKKERERLFGELTLLASFGEYNDIEKMSAGHRQAYQLMEGRPSIIVMSDSWTFGNVSVLSMYHAVPGRLDAELASMDECLPYYISLTRGHGRGADVLMRAEALFCRGQMEEAEILAHKAWYQAELGQQNSIYIGAAALLARLALYRGDAAEFVSVMECSYHQAEKTGQKSNLMEADMAHGFLMGLVGAPQEMADWLRKGDIGEKRLFAMAIPYAQALYGQYLVAGDKPEIWLGMADDAQQLADYFHYVLVLIYQKLNTAMAWNLRKNRAKAEAALGEALALALPDRLYMPFAEHYDRIASLLESCCPPKDLGEIQGLAGQQKAGRESLAHALYPAPHALGLTEREYEVAKLAAAGLSNPEIAEQLYISRNTVKSYLKQVYGKLAVDSRAALDRLFSEKPPRVGVPE